MLSEIGENLRDRLYRLYDTHEFVVGVMSNAHGDGSWKKILDFMDYADKVGDKYTSDDILLLSVIIGNETKRS